MHRSCVYMHILSRSEVYSFIFVLFIIQYWHIVRKKLCKRRLSIWILAIRTRVINRYVETGVLLKYFLSKEQNKNKTTRSSISLASRPIGRQICISRNVKTRVPLYCNFNFWYTVVLLIVRVVAFVYCKEVYRTLWLIFWIFCVHNMCALV